MVQTELETKKKPELKVNYDPTGDVLYVSFDDPRPARSVEIEDGVFLRLDPDSEQPVGFTVVDFYKRFSEHPDNILTFPFPQFVQTTGENRK